MGGAPATTIGPRTDRETRDALERPYHVIILNDDEHTFDYVIEMLVAVFGMSVPEAFSRTVEADATGSAVVFTGSLERAEFKRDCVHGYGPDWRMQHSRGSVVALVEPAAV
jgi:ATP-dependent Clp protease adaptor protein ClpS